MQSLWRCQGDNSLIQSELNFFQVKAHSWIDSSIIGWKSSVGAWVSFLIVLRTFDSIGSHGRCLCFRRRRQREGRNLLEWCSCFTPQKFIRQRPRTHNHNVDQCAQLNAWHKVLLRERSHLHQKTTGPVDSERADSIGRIAQTHFHPELQRPDHSWWCLSTWWD